MNKLIAIIIAMCVTFALCACTGNSVTTTNADAQTTAAETEPETTEPETTEAEATEAPADDVKGEGVMTYAEYAAAALDSEITVETYVQAKQSWWDNKGTFYTQDKDGAYFLYDMPCTEEEYNQLTPGTKIKVKGYKSEWSGEVEIIDATFEIEEGYYIAEVTDVTSLLGTDELINKMNVFAAFKGMKVEPSTVDGEEGEHAYLYKWNNSGVQGDDLYFNVSYNGQTFTFTVESYLCGKDTDVYKAVEALKIGDVIDMEGFLYWYNGANPHITSVTVVTPAE